MLRSPVWELVPERELRVLGHHLRGPRRVEDHLRMDLVDALELPDELAHLLRDLRADRAGGRRQREGDVRLVALDLDVVDESERDEVEAELGVDYLLERLVDVVFCRGSCRHAQRRIGGARPGPCSIWVAYDPKGSTVSRGAG